MYDDGWQLMRMLNRGESRRVEEGIFFFFFLLFWKIERLIFAPESSFAFWETDLGRNSIARNIILEKKLVNLDDNEMVYILI